MRRRWRSQMCRKPGSARLRLLHRPGQLCPAALTACTVLAVPGPALKERGSGVQPWALAQMLTGVLLLSLPPHVHLPWASKQRATRGCRLQVTERAQVVGPGKGREGAKCVPHRMVLMPLGASLLQPSAALSPSTGCHLQSSRNSER